MRIWPWVIGIPAGAVLLVGAGWPDSTAGVASVPPQAVSEGLAPHLHSAVRYEGGATGCTLPDPSGTGGCVTGATAWMLTQVQSAFGDSPVTCWDAHTWNPTSDHPLGRACDFTIGSLGHFPGVVATRRGWALATWARINAAALRISYIIWQGRIWSGARNRDSWRRYSGGGIYDPTDPTGGHYDHVHISLAE